MSRLKALRSRHEILDAKIDREQKALRPDGFRITALKKIRLRLRDEIAALESRFALRPRPALLSGPAGRAGS